MQKKTEKHDTNYYLSGKHNVNTHKKSMQENLYKIMQNENRDNKRRN